ncbi:hypothetical protein TELCIR_02070 [Teladorsagia circumcincta]|uniref:G-protein coupled receptors family 1 profile domain-containing protein n=1 Tax=Teladorsagia circumcincta TaxID=45464 RepID=A0A2G9V080_TELCI|nr:hypothetical protein TELCIR_02070 [Teladorsagia circumcincta]
MAGDSMAYVSLGPARFLDRPRLSLLATSLMLVTDIYSFMTIAMCMVYKYITVTGGCPSAKRILCSIGLFYLLPLSSGAALMLYNPDFKVLHKMIEGFHPEYNMQRYGRYSGLPDVKNYFIMYFLVVVCLIGVGSYVVMIVAGLKALVIQSCMPIFFSFPTKFLYFFIQFGVFESLTAEYLVFAMSPMITVVDPCVTMYYVLPYRHFILRKLRLSKTKESASTIDVPTAASPPPRSVHFTTETL